MALLQSLTFWISNLVDRIAGMERVEVPSDASIFYSRHSSTPRNR